VLIQNVNRVKEIALQPSARGKKRRSTTLSGIPFRHLTQFQLNNLLRLQRTTTEDVASSTEYRSARYVGSSSRGSQNHCSTTELTRLYAMNSGIFGIPGAVPTGLG
jgi:hypothetical protein